MFAMFCSIETKNRSFIVEGSVELGAGLGLPSIVASNLGAKMIATDGDDAVLHLLGANTEYNSPLCHVQKLLCGSSSAQ